MRRKPILTVIEGGKSAQNISAENVSGNFDAAAFLFHDDDVFIFTEIPPEYYGKIIDGVQYGDPTIPDVTLLTDDEILKFTP